MSRQSDGGPVAGTGPPQQAKATTTTTTTTTPTSSSSSSAGAVGAPASVAAVGGTISAASAAAAAAAGGTGTTATTTTTTTSTPATNNSNSNSCSDNNNNNSSSGSPAYQSKRPPGRPRKQVPSELILQRKKIGYFPGRPRGSVRVRRKPASLEDGASLSSGAASVEASTGPPAPPPPPPLPPPSPGGVGLHATPSLTPQRAATPSSGLQPPASLCPDEPELAEGLIQGALTTTTTAAIMAGPSDSAVDEPLCGLCNLAERNPYLSSPFLSARIGPTKSEGAGGGGVSGSSTSGCGGSGAGGTSSCSSSAGGAAGGPAGVGAAGAGGGGGGCCGGASGGAGSGSDVEKPPKRRRIRTSTKSGADGNATCLEDICNVGVIPPGDEPLDVAAVADAQGTVRVHTVCARWSAGYEAARPGALEALLDESLRRACSHCRRLGASVKCAFDGCGRTFHLLCAVGAACAIDGARKRIYCQGEHSAQLKLTCDTCTRPTDTRESLWCTACSKYYHVSCTDTPPGTSVVSNLRMGWLCAGCRACPICHGGSLERAVTCDSCRKCYHMQCVRPALNHLPKHGYKCVLCRFCGDCGSRTPGSGPSSRWHMNYTVCDSCYQQRNKGMSCPLCGKAYRASSSSKMIDFTQCSTLTVCSRWYLHIFREVSDLLLSTFDSSESTSFGVSQARHCGNQYKILEFRLTD